MHSKHIVYLLFILLTASCGSSETDYQGYVEGQNLFMASPFSGILKELAVARGQKVKKGELLFILNPDPESFDIKQINNERLQAYDTLLDLMKPERVQEINAIIAQIKEVDAQIELAKIRVQRYQTLFAKRAVSKDTLDAAVTQLKQQRETKKRLEANLSLAQQGSREYRIKAQQAQVQAVDAKFAKAQWNLSQKTLRAPVHGIIFDTYFSPGEFVPAQQPVLSLLGYDNIYLVFFISIKTLGKVKMDQTVFFNCAGCKKNNKATINYISPEAEYLPPLVYSRENKDKLVFRVHAKPDYPFDFKAGQPVWIRLNAR